MKILITGGAGFLGMHLANFFISKKLSVTLLDISDIDRSEYQGEFVFVKGDIRDKKTVNKLAENKDVIIHAAAALPLWEKKDIFEVNVEGTRNVLDAALKNNIKRVIFISSTAVYGVPKIHPIGENAPRIGVGPYGESKILGEDICFSYMKKGLNVTIIRPKTFVGTGRLGVFEILFDWIHDGKKIPVIGDGGNHYQLLDVDDLVEAIYLFNLKDNKKYNNAFNIGALEFQTVKKDLTALFESTRAGSKVFPVPSFLVKKPLWLFEKLGISPLYQWVYDTADKDSYVSINRLSETLNWKPKYSNSQALIKAYRWYLNHYQEIKSKSPGITHTVGWKQGILGLFKRLM